MKQTYTLLAVGILCIIQISEAVNCNALGGRCISMCMGTGGTFDCANGAIVNKGCTEGKRCCVELAEVKTTTTVATTTLKDETPEATGFTENCLSCIQTSIASKATKACCGDFEITWDYWVKCGKPGKGYWACAIDDNCAKRCVKAFMIKYAKEDGNCEYYSKLQEGKKPTILTNVKTEKFWKKVETCCAGATGGC